MEGRNGEAIKNGAVKIGQSSEVKEMAGGQQRFPQSKETGRQRNSRKSESCRPCESLPVSAAGLMNLKLGHKLQRETSNVEMLNLGNISRLHANGDQFRCMHHESFL